MGENETVETLRIEIVGDSTNATEGLSKLISLIERLENIAGQNKGLKSLSNTLDKLERVTSSLNQGAVERVTALTAALERLSGVNISRTLTRRIEEISNAANNITGASIGNISNLAGAANNATQAAAESASSPLNSTFEMAARSVTDLNSELENTARVLREVSNRAESVGRQGQQSASRVAKVTQTLNSHVHKTTSALDKLRMMITRRIIYRALNAVISAITKAFSDGVNAVYQYSKSINGPLAQAMDRLSSSAKYLKGSLGAMLSPLIVSVTPLLEQLVDKLVNVLNIANQVMARLSGQTTWTRAVKTMSEYAEAADDANASLKALKKTILGIDEINALTDNSTSGTTKANKYEGYDFEEVPIDIPYIDGVIDKLTTLWDIVKGIGIAFAAWKIVSGVTNLLGVLSKFGKGGGAGGVGGAFRNIVAVVAGIPAVITVIGGILEIPGLDKALNHGIDAVQRTFKGLWEVGLQILAAEADLVLMGQVKVETVGKGLANMGIVVDGIPAVITALGGLMSIPGFSDFLTAGVSSVIEVFKGIGSVGVELAGVCTAAVIMGQFDISAVAQGLGAIGLVIGGMEVILIALGGLMQLEGFQWIVSEGGEALAQLGNIIGDFVGSIAGGLIESVSDSFPEVGTNLSAFMENAKGFFDGLSGIDTNIGSTVEALATSFLILTASELLDGIASFFGAKDTIDKFIGMLPSLGEGVAAFAEKTANIDAEKAMASSYVVEIITGFANAVPKSGGLLQLIGGEKDYQTFFNFIPTMADKLVSFSAKIEDLKTDAVEKTKNSVDIIMAYANAVPKTGLLQKITGEPDYQSFIAYMPSLATVMVKYSKNIAALDVDVISKTDDAVKTLLAYANTIPKSTGLWGLIGGEPMHQEFIKFLPSLGLGMKTYYSYVKNVQADVIERSAYAAGALAELAKNLPESGAFWGLFDSDLEDFGESLADFGEYFAEYYGYIKDINSAKATNISDSLASLVDTAQRISGGNLGSAVSDFAKNLKNSASDLKSFFNTTFDYNTGFWIGKSFGESIVTGMKSAMRSASWEYKSYESSAGGYKLLPMFAEGGFPDTGSVFVAQENGAPELVGRIGRRTAVASGDQIVDAVAIGVSDANAVQNELLREQNNLLRQILAKDTDVVANVSTDSIIDALGRTNRRAGKTIIPVG